MRAFQQFYSHPLGENSHYISARNRFCVFFFLAVKLHANSPQYQSPNPATCKKVNLPAILCFLVSCSATSTNNLLLEKDQ